MLTTAEILKEKKLKVTPQRLAIFHALSHTTAHPSAETIYTGLRETHPTMSLATVYKTLDALIKADLVQQINVGEDVYRYDANIQSHPHIVCTKCNCVQDLATKPVADIREKVQAETDFTVTFEQLYFYGLCPECK